MSLMLSCVKRMSRGEMNHVVPTSEGVCAFLILDRWRRRLGIVIVTHPFLRLQKVASCSETVA